MVLTEQFFGMVLFLSVTFLLSCCQIVCVCVRYGTDEAVSLCNILAVLLCVCVCRMVLTEQFFCVTFLLCDLYVRYSTDEAVSLCNILFV